MSEGEHIRENLQHLWRERVDNVKTRLDSATHRLNGILDEHQSDRISPTGSEGCEGAVRVYTEALAEFLSVSRIYQDLVLHGMVPDEDRRCRPESQTPGVSSE